MNCTEHLYHSILGCQNISTLDVTMYDAVAVEIMQPVQDLACAWLSNKENDLKMLTSNESDLIIKTLYFQQRVPALCICASHFRKGIRASSCGLRVRTSIYIQDRIVVYGRNLKVGKFGLGHWSSTFLTMEASDPPGTYSIRMQKKLVTLIWK